MVIASLSQQMCCSKDQREVSFEILFQDQTPTADITPAGDKIFLFYTEISLRRDIISRNLHKFALFLELTNIPFLRYDPG